MARFHIVHLSIALTLLSAASAELATELCKNTTDFGFCRSAVYSDPRAATADQFELIDIVFRKASINATDTQNYIASILKSGGGTESKSLKKCLGNYNKANQNLSVMFNDLNSESYYELDVMSLEVERAALNCKKDLQKSSIIYQRNENMLKLANICYVVSKLFHYND